MEHFMSKDNANSVLSEYASKIKTLVPTEITWANYQLLTEEQKASKRWLIIDYPDAGGGAVFTITLTGDGDETPYSVDKTPAEVIEAYDAGKVLQLKYADTNQIAPMQGASKYGTFFGAAFGMTAVSSSGYAYSNKEYAKTEMVQLMSSDGVTWNISNQSDMLCPVFTTMPIPSVKYLGKTVQYLGVSETPSEYIHGYFYECVQTSSDPATYEWRQIDVQPSADVSDKADKVTDATNGNFAGLDANGNLTDSGKKASDFLTQHQDISGKADKPSTATTGNFASFDANKNPVDSGKKASDFMLDETVGVAKGGTGATTLASGAVLIGNGTGAVQTRGIASVSSGANIPNDNTLITSASVRYALNRGNCVNGADTNYTTYMARGIAAGTSDLTPGTTAMTNGLIYIVYE